MSLADLGRLAWWLGPRAGAPAPAVAREDVALPASAPDERPMRAWVFTPRGRRPSGSLLLVPGLHPDGPADPRMTRFAAVLAHAGLMVFAPFLPDFCALTLDPRLMHDTARAFDALCARADRPPGRPGVMSISFGSLPALRLASDPARAARIGGVLTFGGYADWQTALRFALSGGDGVPHDPLNRPAVFLNLLDGLPPLADRARVEAAWRGFVAETWGRPEMKAADAWPAVAARWAEAVHPADRALCRQTFGLDPGAEALAEAALARRGRPAWLDPRPALAGLRAPLHVVHGRDDDVIPHTEAALLAAAAPPGHPVRVRLTGAWGHTGRAGGALSEVAATVGILRALRGVATAR